MSRGIEAGKAVVTIDGNDTPLQGAIRKAQARLRGLASTSRAVGGAMMGVGGAIVGPLMMAVKGASDLQETMNKFNVVFGDNATAVKKWSDDYANSVGRSRKQVAGFMADTQDLLKPMGFAADAATDMSKEVTKLAIDLASFGNYADDDVLRDLKSALTGSGEVMKKYGVIVSQAAVNQELLNMQLDPKHATEAEKAQARFNIILRGTTDAQGDALNSAGQFANMMKRVQSNIENVSDEIGMALIPVLESFLGKVVDWLAVGAKWVEQNKEMIPLIGLVGAGLMGLGGVILTLGAVASGLNAVLMVGAGLLTYIGAPILAAAAAGFAIGAAFLWATGALDEFWSGFKEGLDATGRALNAGGIEAAFEAMWLSMLATARDAAASILDTIADMIQKITENPVAMAAFGLTGVVLGDDIGELASSGLRQGAEGFRMDAKSVRRDRDVYIENLKKESEIDKQIKALQKKLAPDEKELEQRGGAEAGAAIAGLAGAVDFNQVMGGKGGSPIDLADRFQEMAEVQRSTFDQSDEWQGEMLRATLNIEASNAELLNEIKQGGTYQ